MRKALPPAALALFLGYAAGCRGEPPAGTAESPPPAATGDSATGPASAAVEDEVRDAFLTSRDALRALDVEAYLEGYARGGGLVVVDPAGEFAGREAFEGFVRAWFAEARRRGETFPVVTARERVHLLDESTAALVVHWSVPRAPRPYRSLIVYRRLPEGWRIVAEHSAEVPREEGAASPRADSGN